MNSIQAGEDTELELKEIVFRGGRISFAREEGRAASKLAEVFVSMANTKGGEVVMGVPNSDRIPVGIDHEKRDLLEQIRSQRGAEQLQAYDRTGVELGIPSRRRQRAKAVSDC